MAEPGEDFDSIDPLRLPLVIFPTHVADLRRIQTEVAPHGFEDEDLEIRVTIRRQLVFEPGFVGRMKGERAGSMTGKLPGAEDEG